MIRLDRLRLTKILLYLLMIGLLLWGIAVAVIYRQANVYRHSTPPSAQAALVLGARAYLHGQPNACLVARVARAADLYRQGQVRLIVVSGGRDREDNVLESAEMAAWLVQRGVPEAHIIQESAATSTRENMRLSLPILQQQHIDQVIVVSQSFHLPRALWLAQQEWGGQIQVFAAAAREDCGAQDWAIPRAYAREPLAFVQNAVF